MRYKSTLNVSESKVRLSQNPKNLKIRYSKEPRKRTADSPALYEVPREASALWTYKLSQNLQSKEEEAKIWVKVGRLCILDVLIHPIQKCGGREDKDHNPNRLLIRER